MAGFAVSTYGRVSGVHQGTVFMAAAIGYPRAMANPQKATPQDNTAYRSLEQVLGCKWSTAVVAALGQGVHRPGELERFIDGISTKVLMERLRGLMENQLVARTEHDGRVLHVEYRLTSAGARLAAIIDQLRDEQRKQSSQIDHNAAKYTDNEP
jgi:DNA-binding HxlR family transcriptional regulator